MSLAETYLNHDYASLLLSERTQLKNVTYIGITCVSIEVHFVDGSKIRLEHKSDSRPTVMNRR